MRRLAPTASDDDLLRAVDDWVRLLAEGRYADAHAFLYHPWLPVLPDDELDADSIKAAVTTYGALTPLPDGPFRVSPVGPFRVTPVETAQLRRDVPEHQPKRDIVRFDAPEEHAYDPSLVRFGGAPSGAAILGHIYLDLPLDGEWSDLTATFTIVRYDGAVVLALESIDIW